MKKMKHPPRRVWRLLIPVLCLALLPAGCGSAGERTTLSVSAMDTFMSIELYGSMETASKVKEQIESLDLHLSPTVKSSDMTRLNHRKKIKAHEESAEAVKQALKYCKETDGALDITVYPLVKEWGFLSGSYKVPDKAKIQELLQKVDYRKVNVSGSEITLSDGAQIDMGAVAKGFAADKANEILKSENVTSAILNLGGTVSAYGAKPDGSDWKVGIANPIDGGEPIGTVSCKDKIIATSGNYERYFEKDGKRYCHMIDPKTGYPVDNDMSSVSVVSDSGVESDCLSTALYVMGQKKALEYQKSHPEIDLVILTKNKEVIVTDGIKEKFQLNDKTYSMK